MAESGKIEQHILEMLIGNNLGRYREEVSCGPAFGVDVAVVDLPNGFSIISTSDPLSLIPSLGLEESAWLSVHLLANDMATTGFAPQYGQFILNLPISFSKADFQTYWQHIHKFCKEIGVAITGGHTGFIEGQHSTIAGGGTFSTVAATAAIRLSKNARARQSIFVTGQAAMTATAVLAMSFPKTVQNKLGMEIHEKACGLFYQTTSLNAGVVAGSLVAVSAMHDVTEGGLLGAIYELAVASGNGVEVWSEALPIGDEVQAVCGLFSLDPRFVVGAGSMVISVDEIAENELIERFEAAEINVTKVGRLLPKSEGLNLVENGRSRQMPYFERDPYWAAFFEALKKGWL